MLNMALDRDAHAIPNCYSLCMIQCIATGLDNGKQIDAIALDFTKALDKVTHRCLYQRLHYYGIRGTVLDWIVNFLTNRSQQVVLDGCFSDTLPVTSGVPQGTVLGSLLLLCFVNNMLNKNTLGVKKV